MRSGPRAPRACMFMGRARGVMNDRTATLMSSSNMTASSFSLLDLAGIKLILEDRLGIEVHITTRNSLHPMLRADIEKEAIRVF